MRGLSFRNTALFKRGIWLSAAALVVFVAGPAAIDGAWRRDPLPSGIAVGILCAALVFFFWKTQIHRLADEVIDCGDVLTVRRGRSEALIPMSNISGAEVSSSGGFHRITLRLHTASKFGQRIEFLPQASLWSNIDRIRSVALELSERAKSSVPRIP